MTSKSPWSIEAVQQGLDTDEVTDWYQGNPGPAMRGCIGSWCKPGMAKPDKVIWLHVTHLATGCTKKARIFKERRRYVACYEGENLTLEEATKRMKEELRPVP